MKNKVSRLLVVLLLSAIVSAVSATGVRQDSDAEPKVLQFALSGNPDTLDPHGTSGTLTFQVIRSFYDTLVEPDRNAVIVPALAESWSVSSDGLVWQFDLRPGVRFHNGDELTAGDVRATLERLVAPEMDSGKASEFTVIEEISTPDELTVVLWLSEPSAALLSSLASGWGAILPESLIKSGHDFGGQPVGTGPFTFVEWVQDSRIVMQKNREYWMDGYPLIDGVVVNVIPENAVMVQGLMSGAIDAVESVGAPDRPLLETNPDVVLNQDPWSIVQVLAINTAREPLDNILVRQAVAQAIDKQAVLDVAYGGGEVVSTFMDYANPYYVDFSQLLPYDPEAARQKLGEAGYDNSIPLVMKAPGNFEAHVTAAQMYQAMLEAVGMNIELQVVEWSVWLGEVYRGDRDFDFTVVGHTGKLDPSGRLGGTAESAYGSGTKYVQWVNPTAAEAIGDAARVADPEERKALYTIALEELASEVPMVYIGSSWRVSANRSNVSGFHQDLQLDTFDFRYVEIDD